MRVADADDVREDLELAILELQDRFNVAPRSIRRYVNAAINATEDEDGTRASSWLRKRWGAGP